MGTYRLSITPKGETLLVSGQVTRIVTPTNVNYTQIKDYCLGLAEGEELDMSYVSGLIDAPIEAVNKLVKLSERVSYKKGKLFFDGDEVENALAKHIIRMIKAGDSDYMPFVHFLEKLATNPRKSSRKSLFDFVQARDFTITEDGDFVAYKGVNGDYTSRFAGTATVDGVEVVGNIPNKVGSVIEMPRAEVNGNREVACSQGLHAGTRSYATSYAGSTGRMLAVAINPRDVVMVPRDGGGQKLRVCRYTVMEDNEREYDEPVLRTSKPVAQDEYFCNGGCGDPVESEGDMCDLCFQANEEIDLDGGSGTCACGCGTPL